MLYKFKSQVAADVIMLQPDAETLLKIIGKTPGAQGIITAEQVPGAVRALREAIAAQKRGEIKPADSSDQDKDEDGRNDHGVSLDRRAGPLIDLMERTAAEGKDVVWGV